MARYMSGSYNLLNVLGARTLALPEAWWCAGLPDSVAYHIQFLLCL
jgi:hypothetical protein